MFGFLVFILFAGLLIVLFVLSSVFAVFRSVLGIFGFGRRSRRAQQPFAQHDEPEQQPRREKIFQKDEGEYVDFEEVK